AGAVHVEVIEAALPRKRGDHDLRGERGIALVVNGTPALGERGGQIESAGRYRAQRVAGRPPRGRGHGAPSTVPARTGRPARKSRADIGRRPSGCSSTMASRPALPVAT